MKKVAGYNNEVLAEYISEAIERMAKMSEKEINSRCLKSLFFSDSADMLFDLNEDYFLDILRKKRNPHGSIPQILQELRTIHRLTQEEAAKQAGIGVRTLQSLESGTNNPTLGNLQKICSLYGVELAIKTSQ